MVFVTPFEQTGPYSTYESEDIVTYAMSGVMSISGMQDREPLKHGGFQSLYEGGLNGAVAALIALYARDLTGEGLETSNFFKEVEHPVMGRIKVPFRLWNMSEGAPKYQRPAPLLERRPARLVTAAMANKTARIAWAVLARQETYRAPVVATN
jgi:crotonobetainyl-CoA:carnitine CoA-transferase CaiB-like acyl-CoA transferase